MYFADRKFVMTIVAMLFSKGQFNVSGCCCRNVVVDQQDANALIESTRWCLSNRQVGVDWMAFNSKDHLQVLEDARKGTKTIVGDCSKTNSRYFLCWIDECILSPFCVLSILSSSFFAFNLYGHYLWPIMQAVLLTFEYFQLAMCWYEQMATTRFIHSNLQW